MRNVAIEATRAEARQLFYSFGQSAMVRMLRKVDCSHDGFEFVELESKNEAAAATEARLCVRVFVTHEEIELADKKMHFLYQGQNCKKGRRYGKKEKNCF